MKPHRTLRLLGLALTMLAAVAGGACGRDGDTAAASGGDRSALSPPVGDPLPQDVYGAWITRSTHENDVGRLSFMPPEHEFCRELVRTRGACWIAESMAGASALDGDQRGQPRLVAYGEAGVRGGDVVMRIVSEPMDECEGTSSTARFEVRGNWLHLEPTSPECDGRVETAPRRLRSTYDRV